MSIEANKSLVRRYFEDAPSNPAARDEIFAPVVHFHAIHHATLNAGVDSSPASERAAYEWQQLLAPNGRAQLTRRP